MSCKKMLAVAAVCTGLLHSGTKSFCLDVIAVSELNGPTAQELAEEIVDNLSGVTVVPGSASFQINSPAVAFTDPRAVGLFSNGNTPAGTLLPPDNQIDPINPVAVYSGGIGVESGVSLSTGFLSDNNPENPGMPGRGVGVQGPNNGYIGFDAIFGGGNEGEVSIWYDLPADNDFLVATGREQVGANDGDAAVLSFDVVIDKPGYLLIDFIFASDEYNAWTASFNDSVTIFVDGVNITTFKDSSTGIVIESPLTLQDLADCELLLENQIAPAPSDLVGSPHMNTGTEYYDHEFGGFSKVLTRESKKILGAGVHAIKIVVQDVSDRSVDSAVFVPTASLRLFNVCRADLDNDGDVDDADFAIAFANFGATDPTMDDGDLDCDGDVDDADFAIAFAEFGSTCNRDLDADFNRDGSVGIEDLDIVLVNFGTSACASRREGDADGDGDVDADDLDIVLNQFGQ